MLEQGVPESQWREMFDAGKILCYVELLGCHLVIQHGKMPNGGTHVKMLVRVCAQFHTVLFLHNSLGVFYTTTFNR